MRFLLCLFLFSVTGCQSARTVISYERDDSSKGRLVAKFVIQH